MPDITQWRVWHDDDDDEEDDDDDIMMMIMYRHYLNSFERKQEYMCFITVNGNHGYINRSYIVSR